MLIHLSSDYYTVKQGFRLAYEASDCPRKCSNAGICNSGKCQCGLNYKGDYCQYLSCPQLCYDSISKGNCDLVSYWYVSSPFKTIKHCLSNIRNLLVKQNVWPFCHVQKHCSSDMPTCWYGLPYHHNIWEVLGYWRHLQMIFCKHGGKGSSCFSIARSFGWRREEKNCGPTQPASLNLFVISRSPK